MRIRVRGDSMRPALADGDEVEVDVTSGIRPRVGDVVLLLQDSATILHRVARVFPDGRIVTWGDGAPTPDPPVSAERILGVARIPRRPLRARVRRTFGAFRALASTLFGRYRKSFPGFPPA